jgi:hypothetical protein
MTGGLANHFILASSPLRHMTSIISREPLWSQSLCNIPSDERVGLSLTIAAGTGQSNHSQIQGSRDS